MRVIDAALGLAATRGPVFACGPDKRPAIAKIDGGRGFLGASLDPAVIRRQFSRPNATLIGMPTGPASGFDAVDLDYRNGAAPWERANARRMETRIHATRSGGCHFLFKHVPGIRNSAGKIAPGVDVRGDGGYIIWWPAHGCRIISDKPVAHWPDWLLGSCPQ